MLTKGINVDIQRVEVLKGPQGTLYGRNTTGGAINYITNKPTDVFEAGIDISYGRFETSQIEGFVSGPLLDTLSGRLAAVDLRSGEGWQQSLTRYPGGNYDELGKKDRQAARGTLDWRPTESLFTELSVTYTRDRGEPQAPQATAIMIQNPQGEETGSPKVRNHPLVPRDTDNNRLALGHSPRAASPSTGAIAMAQQRNLLDGQRESGVGFFRSHDSHPGRRHHGLYR